MCGHTLTTIGSRITLAQFHVLRHAAATASVSFHGCTMHVQFCIVRLQSTIYTPRALNKQSRDSNSLLIGRTSSCYHYSKFGTYAGRLPGIIQHVRIKGASAAAVVFDNPAQKKRSARGILGPTPNAPLLAACFLNGQLIRRQGSAELPCSTMRCRSRGRESEQPVASDPLEGHPTGWCTSVVLAPIRFSWNRELSSNVCQDSGACYHGGRCEGLHWRRPAAAKS
jgi:hypothetical protein